MATSDFCPAHVRSKREHNQKAGADRDGIFKYIYDNDGYQEGATKVTNMIKIKYVVQTAYSFSLREFTLNSTLLKWLP